MGEPEDLAAAEGHIPVLVREVLEALDVRSGEVYLDATVGGGGHGVAILQASAPDGRLLGLDRDPEAVRRAAKRLSAYGDRAAVVHASYVDLLSVSHAAGFAPLHGILFDLGFSSWQIEAPSRGFAFSLAGPLDMRFDPGARVTAADLINDLPEDELAGLLYRYGEEPRGRQIARAIVEARPIYTTVELAEVISRAVGGRRGALHPATLTFQALRIAVNQELESIERALPDAIEALASSGRLAVITFHSLEDRIVKRFLQQESRDCICPSDYPMCQCEHVRTVRLVTRKPMVPSKAEIAANPRSRSAKLRVAEKL
jgi:16S rRNA (cytosine1402-N4)-methyltransferase